MRAVHSSLLVGACLYTSAAIGQGCDSTASPSIAPPALLGPENVVFVRKDTVTSGPTISGSLQPRKRAAIVAEASGSVTQVNAELGAQVTKGQVLARIEINDVGETFQSAKQAAKSAQRSLDIAERDLQRVRQLVQSGALAPAQLDRERDRVAAARAALASAQAQRATASKQLHNTVVHAPIDGVVSEQSVYVGDTVAPGSRLFVLIDPSSMRLEAQVPSDQLHVLKIGAPVEFSVRGLPDRRFTGELTEIAPAADPNTRQISILVSISDATQSLLAGLFAEGRVGTANAEGLVIPEAAVQGAAQADRGSVLLVRNGRIERVEVGLGIRDRKRELVQVTSGLAVGDRLVVNATPNLRAGTRVELLGGDAGSQAALNERSCIESRTSGFC